MLQQIKLKIVYTFLYKTHIRLKGQLLDVVEEFKQNNN